MLRSILSTIAIIGFVQVNCLFGSLSGKARQSSPKFLADTQAKTSFTIPLTRVMDRTQARSLLSSTATTKRVTTSDGTKWADVALTNNYNYDYIGTLMFGNPPQPIRACFDTGSANAWILSSQCTSERCQPHSNNLAFNN